MTSRIWLAGIALADHTLRRDGRDAVGAAGGAIERRVCDLFGFGLHDIGDPQPLLVAIAGVDDAEHHHATADANRPAARVVHRAVAFRGVVNDDEAFRLVTLFVTSPLAAHACPG